MDAETHKVEPTEEQVAKLIPGGIEQFTPKCLACGNDLPAKRLRQKTCSPACATVMRKWKKHRIASTVCQTCHRPASPQERRDFTAWRKHRGELRAQPGRPVREKKLQEALAEAIALVAPQADNEARLVELKKLLDPPTVKQSTLAPSGQTAQGENT